MTWNDEHAGVAAAPAAAIDWSVTAMTEAARRLSSPGPRDLPRLADAIADAVWWVTLVDATLVRYHPRNYETTLGPQRPAARDRADPRRAAVRPQPARQVRRPRRPDHAGRSRGHPARLDMAVTAQPDVSGLGSRARQWELSRYHAYQARLAGRDVTAAFAWCAEFLALAARLAGGEDSPR